MQTPVQLQQVSNALVAICHVTYYGQQWCHENMATCLHRVLYPDMDSLFSLQLPVIVHWNIGIGIVLS